MGQSSAQRRREEYSRLFGPKKAEETQAPKKAPSKPRQKKVKDNADQD